TILGAIREFLGAGSIFGLQILPENIPAVIMIMAPGGFIVLGILLAVFTHLKSRPRKESKA
ncbi:MAG: electron transport complex subunit RsxE, partial [Firmicutes bacterium]|nr:electron transport complex subunit RsxE [Bacillota bacterium]